MVAFKWPHVGFISFALSFHIGLLKLDPYDDTKPAFGKLALYKVMQVCTSMAAPWNVMEQLEKWLRVLQVFFATSCFQNYRYDLAGSP